MKRFLNFLDKNKDGVISFQTEFIPFIYTVFVGFMVFKEAQFVGEVFTDTKFIAIIGGSLGVEFIRAMAKVYQIKSKRNEDFPEHPIDPGYSNPNV